jgi:hypothetical protein
MGIAALMLSGWYFTVFDFWNTGQAELWEGLCLVASYCAAVRQPSVKGALLSGSLAALALLFKFTALLPALAIAIAVALGGEGVAWRERGPRRALARLAAFVAGGCTVVGLTWGYFAAVGAARSVSETFEFLIHYATNDTHMENANRLIADFWCKKSGWWLSLFISAWTSTLVYSVRKRNWALSRDLVLAGMLGALAAASAYAQRKFFDYHWGVVGPFLVLMALYGMVSIPRRHLPFAFVVAVTLLVGGWIGASPWKMNSEVSYRTYSLDYWLRRRHMTRAEFDAVFIAEANYNYNAQVRISQMIKERAQPGDMLHVRGFELAMYAITGLRTPARFVSELPIDEPSWSIHHDEWSAQQENAIWSNRPRFIVTFNDRPFDLARTSAHSYREIGRAGLFVLFERIDGDPITDPSPPSGS